MRTNQDRDQRIIAVIASAPNVAGALNDRGRSAGGPGPARRRL